MNGLTFDEEQKLWTSADTPQIINPSASVGQVVHYALKTHGSRVAQINADSGIRLRYDELLLRSIRIAQNLRARGYQKGQIFGYSARNSHHVAPIIFAAWYLGCTVNAIDDSFGPKEFTYMMKTTQPVLVFCDVHLCDMVKQCLDDLENTAKIFTIGGQTGRSEPVESLLAENGDETDFVPSNVDAVNDVAMVTCSSGSTGLSKAICHSHAMLTDRISRYGMLCAHDVMLCFSSLYWMTGLRSLILGTLAGATRIITTERSSAELEIRLIEQYKVTYLLNSPDQSLVLYRSGLLEKADLSSVRYYLTGGNRVSHEIHAYINKYLPNGKISVYYGLSEASGTITINYPITEVNNKSCGRFLGGMRVKIIDDNGNMCGVGDSGEICLKSSHKPLGYYNNPAANSKLFDADDFLLTGDVGYIDKNGLLYIIDRKKDMLVYKDDIIWPAHLEDHLAKSPLIRSVCVVGIPHELYGDLIAAAVVATAGAKITEQMVHAMIDELPSDYCKLRGGVYFLDSMPTSSTGKIRKPIAKKILVDLFNKAKMTHIYAE